MNISVLHSQIELNEKLKKIKSVLSDISSNAIDEIQDTYYLKTHHHIDYDIVFEGLYRNILNRMGFTTTTSLNESIDVPKTVEDVIDEYMVYGGQSFHIKFIDAFEDIQHNHILNHAIVNYCAQLI